MYSSHKSVKIIAGILAGLLIPLVASEIYLRNFPVKEIQQFLGEKSPLTGIYAPHDGFGITYSSWRSMDEDNRFKEKRLRINQKSDSRPLWIICGSSFADRLYEDARKYIQDYRVAKLHRHGISLPLQMAQTEMLLAKGLRPERIFFVILTLEGDELGRQPLRTRYISSSGALLYKPRSAPDGLDWLVRNSRTALTAWVRSGRAMGTPGFNRKVLYSRVDENLVEDFRRLFASMVKVARPAGAEVTVIFVPRRRQTIKGAGYVFQDTLTPVFESIGIDVIDPRNDFSAEKNMDKLYLPDGHLSEAGDKIIIKNMLMSVTSERVEAADGL